MRDMIANPYSPDERRVAQFLFDRGLGGGDDPIGFILSSYAYVIHERNATKDENERLREKLKPLAERPEDACPDCGVDVVRWGSHGIGCPMER